MEKSYHVLNALSLINEDLGKAYEETGYTPYDDSFELKEEYVENILKTAKTKKELAIPEFLEQGNRTVSQNFKTALENITLLKDELTANFPETLNKDILVYLENFKELLTLSIEKLKSRDADSFKLYSDLYNLDPAYGEILKECYFKEFNKQVAIQNFLGLLHLTELKKEAETLKKQVESAKRKTQIVQKAPEKQREEEREERREEKSSEEPTPAPKKISTRKPASITQKEELEK